jgi:tetratricopeptide (TPR) repeat protein
MTPEQWQNATRLFTKCLDTLPQYRDELLAAEGVSEEIRQEVCRLLKNLEQVETEVAENPPAGAPEGPRLEVGAVLANRFRIVRFLGTGGMGQVYEAQDEDIGEAIALKLVRPGHSAPLLSARLRRELQLARRVAHPNVCRLFDLNRHTFPWGEGEFLTMELVRGVTLAELMKSHGRFAPEECFPYLRDILAGLQAVHELGIVHRDLKPGNVMVSSDFHGRARCVLMDFGLARQGIPVTGKTTVTASRQVMGTVPYMAPEQLAGGQVSARTDLYAFGIIMHELLHGRLPHESAGKGNREQLQESDIQQPPAQQPLASVEAVPNTWRNVIEQCLQPDPERRPASAAAISALLDRKAWLSRRSLLLAGASAAAAAAAGYIFHHESGPRFVRGSSLLVAGSMGPSGDPLAVQIRALLRQSSQLKVWDNGNALDVWRRMGRQGSPDPSTRDWREIAMRESLEFVLFPSMTQVGDGSSMSLRLEQLKNNPNTPVKTWQKSFEAPDRDHLFEAIDAGSRWIRDLVGESLTQIDNSSAKPRAVTTPSWEALTEFSRAEGLMGRLEREPAVLAFRSAARLDPLFTMAWMRLGDVQVWLGHDNEAFAAWQRAEEVSRERPLTRREDLRFRAMFASDCANYSAAEKLFKEYSFYFPDEWYGTFYRALPLLMMGRVKESIPELQKSLDVANLEAWVRLELVTHYIYADDRKSAEAMVSRLKKLGDVPRAGYSEAMIAHAADETDAAVNGLSRSAVDSTLMSRSKETLSQAIVLADGGRIGKAIDVLRAAAAEDEGKGERERWAAKLIGLANLMSMDGDRKFAMEAIRPLRRVDVGPGHTGAAGVLFARFGDTAQADRLLGRIPEELYYPRFQVPRLHIQAELLFADGKTAEGLHLAKQAAQLEPAAYGSQFLAESLDRFATKQEALAEYRDCLKSKCFQLFLATPAPVGSWYQASAAVRRLESV